MIAVLQRSDGVKCVVDDKITSKIDGKCLLILIGVHKDDTNEDIEYIVRKIPELRIFEDEDGKMNLSAKDVNAGLFVVSQFTLFARCKKGKRPNFMDAAGAQKGKEYYEKIVQELRNTGLEVGTGEFGEHMNIVFNNDGPVTILLDSRE